MERIEGQAREEGGEGGGGEWRVVAVVQQRCG
jgi:hypothetical protein